MCYRTRHVCSKHGDTTKSGWQGNKYVTECTQPGCTGKFTLTQQVTKSQNNREYIGYIITENTL